MIDYAKVPRKELNIIVKRVVAECNRKANKYVKNYELINKAWPVIEGCAYIRLSTPEQVAKEKGSLEQQINIAVAEAEERSRKDKINYKITRFFIELPITGQTDRRPEFQRMQRMIYKDHFKFAIFKEIARLMRDSAIWKKFFNISIEAECEIFVRGLPFNPNDPTQMFNLDILAAVAAYESRNTGKRVRENVFSAMVNSGKFNSTQKVLGLDQLVINGEPQTGFYVPNHEELKKVEWIMRTFLRVGSYPVTLVECKTAKIFNKGGEPFKDGSLRRLLTNPKYIGRWIVNEENKNKNQKKLMPYERYQVIDDLPHGCVIDKELWQEVQLKVQEIAGNHDKNTGIKRIYPLSGLLRYIDGTPFGGSGNWGENSKVFYYLNQANNFRLLAIPIEEETQKIVAEIVKNSPKLKEAIGRRLEQVSSMNTLIDGHAIEVEAKLAELKEKEGKLEERLDAILEDADAEEIALFRKKYRKKTLRLEEQIEECEEALRDFDRRRQDLANDEFDKKLAMKKADRVLAVMKEKDPVALKNAYRQLFDAIIITDVKKDGSRDLNFVLKDNLDDLLDSVNQEEKKCISRKMAPRARLELATG